MKVKQYLGKEGRSKICSWRSYRNICHHPPTTFFPIMPRVGQSYDEERRKMWQLRLPTAPHPACKLCQGTKEEESNQPVKMTEAEMRLFPPRSPTRIRELVPREYSFRGPRHCLVWIEQEMGTLPYSEAAQSRGQVAERTREERRRWRLRRIVQNAFPRQKRKKKFCGVMERRLSLLSSFSIYIQRGHGGCASKLIRPRFRWGELFRIEDCITNRTNSAHRTFASLHNN